MLGVAQPLLFINVDRRHAGPAAPPRAGIAASLFWSVESWYSVSGFDSKIYGAAMNMKKTLVAIAIIVALGAIGIVVQFQFAPLSYAGDPIFVPPPPP